MKSFDGSGDVNEFITKIKLQASLKGYDAGKQAEFMASRLEGRAFDVYLRLNDENKKLIDVICHELRREFERGNSNREEALHSLSCRKRLSNEAAQTYAYKLLELVKLAYLTFNDDTRKQIAKDYFVRGLHPEMQVSIKSLSNFPSADINQLAEDTTRLHLAGVRSYYDSSTQSSVNNVNLDNTLVDTIAEKVFEKFKDMSTDQNHDANQATNAINRRPRYSGPHQQNKQPRCYVCQSTSHKIRDCPKRFCQACGKQGHDSWQNRCRR